MANTARRSVLRTRALVIGGITFSIFVGVAVLGWVAGWQTADKYSAALRITGVGVVLVGVVWTMGIAWVAGMHTREPEGEYGVVSLTRSQYEAHTQFDDDYPIKGSFAFLVMMAGTGLLVLGGSFVLQVLVG